MSFRINSLKSVNFDNKKISCSYINQSEVSSNKNTNLITPSKTQKIPNTILQTANNYMVNSDGSLFIIPPKKKPPENKLFDNSDILKGGKIPNTILQTTNNYMVNPDGSLLIIPPKKKTSKKKQHSKKECKEIVVGNDVLIYDSKEKIWKIKYFS